jgi:TRAP-type uncharacterized transport system substrate-binding protein
MRKEPTGLADHSLIRVGAACLLVLLLAAAIAWIFMPAPLPKVVRFGTGPEDGYYARFGLALQEKAMKRGVRLELVTTAGSVDNIRLLLDGSIDVGIIQGGNLNDADAEQLSSVASVFYEPLLQVERVDWDDHIEGGRIGIGEAGSGVNALATKLLADQGVHDGAPPGTQLIPIGSDEAVDALRAGELDSAVFISSVTLPWVRMLFEDPGLRVVNFDLAEAFSRHYRYLKRSVIPAGLIDLRKEIPSEDIEVLVTTASLVVRPDIHPALIPLLIESARDQLDQGSLLAGAGEFPSAYGVEAPLANEARQYFEQGPSFFYRWLPFRYASAATRFMIILIPLLTLLYPLMRLAGPAYQMVNRARIYRWYRFLKKIERRMDARTDTTDLRQIRKELEHLDAEIRSMHVPSGYSAELYTLRVHQRLLVDRLASMEADR